MAFELIRELARTEIDDNLHMSRLLLLLDAIRGKTNKPLDGITKLAKLDFLLRYPTSLERALSAIGVGAQTTLVRDFERKTVEARMVRFRYGPWDPLYRRWLALLVAKRLVHLSTYGRTVQIYCTNSGRDIADALAEKAELSDVAQRARLVVEHFSGKSGKALAELFEDVFPELESVRWGADINL